MEKIETIVGGAYARCIDVLDFGRGLWERSSEFRPKPHQFLRIYEAIKNGTDRLVLEDTTGAGKTLTGAVIKGLMDEMFKAERGHPARGLVMAPNQTVEGVWNQTEINQYTSDLGLPEQSVLQLSRDNLHLMSTASMITVNYEKISISPDRNAFLEPLMKMLPAIDLVIVDECHNLKNLRSNRTQTFRDIVKGTMGKKFIPMSASAIPNRLVDAGFLLYMFDPKKYSIYSEQEFDYATDRFSIRNAMNSPGWFTFNRDDLKALFGLPALRFSAPELGYLNPHRFEFPQDHAEQYLAAWKKDSGVYGSKVSDLSRLLLQLEFDELQSMCQNIRDHEPDAQIAIFSFYKEGVSEDLKTRLETVFPNEVATITGDTRNVSERLETARLFREGRYRITVNTLSTVSESISLATGDRPAYLILAEPPIVPANYEQVIGRLYRKGQRAPVTVLELIPYSPWLEQMQQEETRMKKSEGIKFRRTWEPGTIFNDKRKIREEKVEEQDKMRNAANLGEILVTADTSDDTKDERAFKSLHPSRSNRNEDFNEGLKRVRSYIGRAIDDLVSSTDRFHLVDSYTMEDWDTTSSADTNKAIAKIIEAIENIHEKSMEDILDWGCGTACLARTMMRPIHNLDLMPEMIEEGKRMCIELGLYNDLTADIHFHLDDAREMKLRNESFDIVSSAYAIQYNIQGAEHKRDIEKILQQTNRVLKPKGYGILALPLKATQQEDQEQFRRVVTRYGFDIVYDDVVSGHAVNEVTKRERKVFGGFHLLVFQKTDYVPELVGEDDIFIFSRYKIGIGGVREKEYFASAARAYKKDKTPATDFKGSDSAPLEATFQDILHKRMRG